MKDGRASNGQIGGSGGPTGLGGPGEMAAGRPAAVIATSLVLKRRPWSEMASDRAIAVNLGTGSTRGGVDGGLEDDARGPGARTNEKLVVPEFNGEGAEMELGKSARSYLRQVAAWLKCTRMPRDRGVALYTHLSGKAWVFAEELDVERLSQVVWTTSRSGSGCASWRWRSPRSPTSCRSCSEGAERRSKSQSGTSMWSSRHFSST